jgi:hypothetical protein
MEEARVQEGRGDDPVRLAIGDRRAEEAEVADDRAAALERGDATAAEHLGEEGEHAGADDPVGHRGVGATGGTNRVSHLGSLLRALRAAHADRGRGHAVGADRPPAVRAGDVGLARRVSVAGRHRALTIAVAVSEG